MNHIVLIAGLAVGLLAAGLAFLVNYEDPRRERPHGHGRRPPPNPPPSPPPRRNQQSSPTRRRRRVPSRDRATSPPPSLTSSHDRATSPPPSLTSSHDRATSPPPIASTPTHDRATSPPPFSQDQVSLCAHATNCTNCRGNYLMMTFLPCKGSFMCKECAMEYLEKSKDCPMCCSRIDAMEIS